MSQSPHSFEEQLSALRDGELDADPTRFLLRRVASDASLAARWQRWQIAGDALRGQPQRLLPGDFAAQVMAAATAPAPAAVAAGAGRRRLQWGAGAAVAASVAVVALLVARPAGEPGPSPAVAVETRDPFTPAAPAGNPFNRFSHPAMSPLPQEPSTLLPIAIGDAPARPWPDAGLGSDTLRASLVLQAAPAPEPAPAAEPEQDE